jgi:hypothetical protein
MNNRGIGTLIVVLIISAVVVAGGLVYLVSNMDSEDKEGSNSGDSGSGNSGSDWCDSNWVKEVYSANSNSQGTKILETKSLGFSNYKGKSACHGYVKLETEAGDQKIISEIDVYGYDYDKGDSWIISKTTFSGQTINYEYHWKNGECIEGNGCDLLN